MIRSFRCRDTEALFQDQTVPRFQAIERVGRRKLLYVHAPTRLEELRVPPGKGLEALKGGRTGQQSIQINDRWRMYFVWRNGEAHDMAKRTKLLNPIHPGEILTEEFMKPLGISINGLSRDLHVPPNLTRFTALYTGPAQLPRLPQYAWESTSA